MALEHKLAPLDLTSSQFIVVIGAMRGRARTVSEFCQFAGVDAGRCRACSTGSKPKASSSACAMISTAARSTSN
jgi:hypothetical protein